MIKICVQPVLRLNLLVSISTDARFNHIFRKSLGMERALHGKEQASHPGNLLRSVTSYHHFILWSWSISFV